MIALKAKYSNGQIEWEKPPPFTGACDLIVVFSPTEVEGDSTSRTAKRHCIEQVQAYFSDVPSDISLVDELIAERRQEATRE